MNGIFRYMAVMVFVIAVGSCSSSDEQATAQNQNQTMGNASPVMQTVAAKPSAEADENGWYHDWDSGMAAAREQERPVLVDFYADWCTWCTVMDEKTFSDAAIKQQFAEGWITIKIDTEDTDNTGSFKGESMTFRDLAGAFGVKSLPSYVFIDKNGEPVNMVTGYREKEQFAVILDFFREEIYTKDEAAQKQYLESKGVGSS